MLTTMYSEGLTSMKEGADVETRLLGFCTASLDSFEVKELALEHLNEDNYES